MNGEELESKIKQLQADLSTEQERYESNLEARSAYTVLRKIRESMRTIRTQLLNLYQQQKK